MPKNKKNRYSEKTQYKGVYKNKAKDSYAAYYCLKGIQYYCGRFDDIRKAVVSRDRKIIEVRGNLNDLQILKPLT